MPEGHAPFLESLDHTIGVERPFRTRWMYFALYSWLQCTGRFTSLYYENEGLTDAEIGLVFAVGYATVPFTAMILSALADSLAAKYGAKARMYCFIAYLAVGTIVFSLQALHFQGIPRMWIMLVCRIPLATAMSVSNSVLDAITVQSLVERRLYGRERLYGAYSWAIVGIALGLLMDCFGPTILHICMPLAFGGVLLAAWLAGSPPDQHTGSSTATQNEERQAVDRREWCNLMKSYASSFSTVAFFVFAITLASGMTLVENLLFLYFRELHASYFVCGLSIIVTVVFEIPLFAAGSQFLAIFGTHGLLTIAGLCYSFRVVGYTLVPDGAWILFFEPMHGVTFAASQTAGVELMASITPAHMAASGQGLLSALRSGIGQTAGNLGGGYIMNAYGGATMFRIAAGVVLAGLVFLVSVHIATRNQQARNLQRT